jgi:hypothetical protein
MSDTELTFRLDSAGLSGPPLEAHIHIGQRKVNGGVSVFFCGGGGKPGDAEGFGSRRITHRLSLPEPNELDEELLARIREAYALALESERP